MTTLPDDYEQQRKAAETFEPELAGPNISAKLPVEDLIVKYAGGHPVYEAKTKNLPHSYDAYRRVKGDRKCGWRAILFRLVEITIELSASEGFDQLVEHLLACKKSIGAIDDAHVDLYDDSIEDFVSCVKNLKLLPPSDAIVQLEQFFEGDSALHAIYCTRLIASAEIRLRRENYEFALEKPLEDYCARDIEGPEEEIAEIGLRAMSDALLNPMGVGLEVVNLHTNPGSTVDIIPYPAPAIGATGGPYTPRTPPVVRLFFTPGHYDLIYSVASSADVKG